MESLAQIYRERRVSLGLTQDQAAAAAGVSRRTLVDFETGGQRISIGNLHRLLSALGLELTARERSTRPTLDELSDQYRGEDIQKPRKRASRKKTK
jgi:transcriptional regulator with XRE-family HTH domain